MGETTKNNNRFYRAIKQFTRKNKWLIIIFVVALLLRLFLLSVNVSNSPDFISAIKGDDGYYEISYNLVTGNGFSYDTDGAFRPNPLRPPLYPYLIAALLHLTGSYLFVILVQVITGSLIPVLGYVIAKKFLTSSKIALAIGLLLALEPYSILMSVIFYTETLFTLLFLIFIYFLFLFIRTNSTSDLVWTSVFLALSVLVKPTVQFLPLLFPLLLMWKHRTILSKSILKKTLILWIIFGAIIAPWLYRNYVEFGKVGMSAQPAFNAYVYFAPSVRAIEFDTGFAQELKAFVHDRAVDENDITLTTGSHYVELALAEILKYPVSIVKLLFISFITFFTHDGMLTVLGYADIRPPVVLSGPVWQVLSNDPGQFFSVLSRMASTPFVLIPIMRVFWILMSLMGIVGLIRLFRKKEFTTMHGVGVLLILYFAGTTMVNGLGVNARFRLPVLIFIATFAFVGVKYVYEYVIEYGVLKKRRK